MQKELNALASDLAAYIKRLDEDTYISPLDGMPQPSGRRPQAAEVAAEGIMKTPLRTSALKVVKSAGKASRKSGDAKAGMAALAEIGRAHV